MKTHWKKLTNPDYIGAYYLDEGMDLTVTIDKVVRENVTGSDGKATECTVAYLKGTKPFILNSTNCKTISKVVGSSYIEEWAGKQITIYVASVRAFGETVDALRVRPTKPKMPELTPSHPKWIGAATAVKNGSVTIDQIRKSFTLTPQNEAKLCENSK